MFEYLGNFFAENNWVYALIVVAILYLAYGYVKGGGVKYMVGRHARKIKGLFSRSAK